ncbi:hypothetical protein [Amycolatopsis sp. CA-230715]|uniref:hypothetical protein n=1 Tax=Amycolatopsis sp. CA-230715 TaxID=2745196 RepID=UPI001C011B14|nr:hypothetical protein [Amycolatopsis sp. CA-230715]QWF78853.1 hypothetical protein HUW46_02251 [Amycolatopsis sp. CA-230715]
MGTILMPVVLIVSGLRFGRRLVRVLTRRAPVEQVRTRVVLDEAHGYGHIDACKREDLVRWL